MIIDKSKQKTKLCKDYQPRKCCICGLMIQPDDLHNDNFEIVNNRIAHTSCIKGTH